MSDPVRIGLLIHRNRALLAQVNQQLSLITGMMPLIEPTMRYRLRGIAREVRWTRAQIRIFGWVLHLIDPR